MDQLLSLCMIVRDEEKVLRRCLDSVNDYVDEIIIVDTGSVDSTKQIAREYTDKVFDFEWINDFSAAKNAAIQRAMSKWILVLDADEYVDSTQMVHLLAMLKQADHDTPMGYILTIYNYTGPIRKGKMVESTALRLFSNHPDIYFERPIHEQVVYRHGHFEQTYYRLSIFHTGYTLEVRQEKNKSTRNLAIFEKLKETRQFEEYDYFTLGNEYFAVGDLKKALYYYKRATTKKMENQAFMLHCLNQTVITLIELDRLKEALEVVESGLSRYPAYADYYCFKGLILEKVGLTTLAIEWFETSLKISNSPPNKDGRYWLVSPNYGSIIPLVHLVNLYLKNSDVPKAVSALTKLINLSPGDQKVLYQLLILLTQSETISSIIDFNKKIFVNPSQTDILQLFQVSLLLGNQELTAHYQYQCEQHKISLSSHYKLLSALIHDSQDEFQRILQLMPPQEQSEHNNKLFILASLVWNQSAYADQLIETIDGSTLQKEQLHQIVQVALQLTTEGTSPTLDSEQLNYAVTLLIDLFKYGYFDAYDRFIEQLQPYYFIVANLIGDHFYSQSQIQLALDYYSMLIQHEQLAAVGYENVGKLYVNQGDVEEGLAFVRKSIELNPYRPYLYVFYLAQCSDADLSKDVLDRYKEQYPHYYGLMMNAMR
ncbi:glycosyltransferase family 2 protein [Paenibacillus alba]|uniref:glycosyltransferase family 2 protein n=1 Tax=Paenibacillus alba TaxID=1197127 RepID=UPI0015650A99|nr:glycosyltransferase family 2 protein [Paenibacillus alba]NQX70106.1 glycosyltransferase family 2 protein [Paenibacillus alba]